jgi:hypothetical protein
METALIGFFGIVFGILLNEYFRRKNRIEDYSSQLFEKRIKVYEGLMARIHNSSHVISDLFDDEETPEEIKIHLAFEEGLKVAGYADKYQLYLNEDISVHCGAAFVGVGDIFEIDDEEERKNRIDSFYTDIREAKLMIKKESGIEEINKLFQTMTKTNHKSPIIEYYHKLKDKQKNNNLV